MSCARASSTSSSITSNIATAGERKSDPITLITATLVPSSAAATVSPRPGANFEKFAGRITRSEVSR